VLGGPPAAAMAAEVSVLVGVVADSEVTLNSVPAGLGGPMNGPDLVKSSGLGPFSRLEAPRWRVGRVAAAAEVTAAPSTVAATACGAWFGVTGLGRVAFSTTGLVMTTGPFALAESIVSAWFPKGLAKLLE
jgi:hypothetical protein